MPITMRHSQRRQSLVASAPHGFPSPDLPAPVLSASDAEQQQRFALSISAPSTGILFSPTGTRTSSSAPAASPSLAAGASANTATVYTDAPYAPRKAFGTELKASVAEWSGETQRLWEATTRGARWFHEHEAGVAHVQATHERYVYRAAPLSLPEGHPRPSCFAWLPLLLGYQLIGIVGFGKKIGTLDDALLDGLQPLSTVCAAMLSARAQMQAHHSTQDKLQEQKDAELTKVRDAFLADMTHELRTPLNAVIHMTRFLKDTKLTSEQREYVDTVDQCGIQILGIVNDVLDYSKISLHQMRLKNGPVSLRQCLEEACAVIAPQARDKAIALSYSLGDEVPSVISSDNKRLQQILVNLLGNALKFTEAGYIMTTVAARRITGEAPNLYELQFAVQDTGMGIAEQDQARIFQSFAQLEYSDKGAGLGLSISRQLTNMLGGRMWLESELGRGSTFYFTIVAEEFVDREALTRKGIELFAGRQALIVDDNPANRLVLFNLVLSWQMQPSLAGSVEEAVVFAKSRRFDIGFIDIRMPQLAPVQGTRGAQVLQYSSTEEGVRLARQLRELGCGFPLIAVSSVGLEFHGAELFQERLCKPVREKRLFEACRWLLLGQREEADEAESAPLKDLRLLVADDKLTNQKVMRALLIKLGYRQHDVVSDGRAAVEAVRESRKSGQHYDALLIDLRLPQLDGCQVAAEVQRLYPVRRERPFLIACTASVQEADRQRCKACGMNGYLAKPISATELETMLQVIYEKRHNHATPPALQV